MIAASDIRDPGRIGVILCNIGGPSSGNVAVVQAFLRNFFSDPAILPVNPFLRWMISRKIARRRGPESAKNYAMVGGRSPILDWTETQRRLLEERLNARGDGKLYRCAVAMRYSPPFTADALDLLDREGFREIISLPLYPQESGATTGSSLAEIDRLIEKMNFDRGVRFITKIGEVRDFAEHPLYLEAMAERARDGMLEMGGGRDLHILFSAHGLPKRFIEKGDPYQKRILATVAGLVRLLGVADRHTLAYQSRVGPEEWLKPDTSAEIDRLAASGVRRMFVVPVAFVSDHIETLHEISIEYKKRAREKGVLQFECMEGLNGSLTFVRALEQIALAAIAVA
ncbi:MAG: ferrochelatase [Planctomycetes bacterium]|nr:ferrochelatase [Planctomycetota bacterium]